MNAEVIQGDALETPTEVLHGLDICAGSGIGSWAFESAGISRTVCYVESDTYCQRVLQARMRSGDLSPAPIWDDLKTFNGRPWRGCVDFVYGGIPCQPYSMAGKRGGTDDPRDLWPDLRRVLRDIQPRIVFLEQVPGFLVHAGGFRRVLGELAEDGYDAVWCVLSAAEVGALHLRKRLWILAYPNGTSREQYTSAGKGDDIFGCVPDVADPSRRQSDGRERGDMADTTGGRRSEYAASEPSGQDANGNSASERLPDWAGGTLGQPSPVTQFERPNGREVERDFRGVAHGVASRVDRLRMLGNGWVPQCAIAAFRELNKRCLSAQPPLFTEVPT